jgi:hypothetical protein
MAFKLKRRTRRWSWYLIILLTAALAWQGLGVQYPEFRQWSRFPERAFRVVKTFTANDALTSAPADTKVVWQLWVAMILGTVVLLAAALKVVQQVFMTQFTEFRILFLRRHALVFGLGEKGYALMTDIRSRKHPKAVAVEQQTTHPKVAELRKRGALVVCGDALEEDTLIESGAQHAGSAICFFNKEQLNIEIAQRLQEICRQRKTAFPLHCYVHISNRRMLEVIEKTNLGTGGGAEKFVLHFFNTYQIIARNFFERFSYESAYPANASGTRQPLRLAILGFNKTGEALVLQAARVAHFINGAKTEIVVIDPKAATQEALFFKNYPHFREICELRFVQGEPESADLYQLLNLGNPQAMSTTTVILTEELDSANLNIALEVLELTPGQQFPVYVRNSASEQISSLFTHAWQEKILKRLRFYGDIHSVCNMEMITNETLDLMARAIHQHYTQTQLERQATPNSINTAGWEELSEDMKNANRAQADHIAYKIAQLGYRTAKKGGSAPTGIPFPGDMLELLAQSEHLRWMANRYLAGWTYAPLRNDGRKQHPSLIPWEQLSAEEKEKDRDTVRLFPEILELAGLQLVPLQVPVL